MIELIIPGIAIVIALLGIRIVRPTEKGIIERLGKYHKAGEQGFHWIIPLVDTMRKVNVTEVRVDIPPQEVITRDKLNAHVDAVVYYRVRNPVKALYNVNNYHTSVVSLARTTLRAVIGKMNLAEANEKREEINHHVEKEMGAQIEKPKEKKEGWGIDILRVEIQEIQPPKDVQDAMNRVVKAENEKIAAVDLANAKETEADGFKRAAIKEAQGVNQSTVLRAQGDAKAVILRANAQADAIKQVSESAAKYFKGNAQVLKKLETVEKSLRRNAKIVVPAKTQLVNVIGDMAGVLPLKQTKS